MRCVRLASFSLEILLGLTALLLLNSLVAAEPEVMICKRTDGTQIFTNRTKDVTGCSEYRIQSELGYVKRIVEEKPPATDERKPIPPQGPAGMPPIQIIINNISAPTPPPAARIEVGAQIGEIPFETSRMLSVGMTEAEVLRRAGQPQSTLIGSYSFGSPYPFWPIFGANRFVYSSGDWVVELTFGGGRVISINQFRPRP
jgi:hypothetical protein